MDKSIIEKTRESAKTSSALADLDKAYVKVDEIPFDFARKRMSVVVKDQSGKTQMITKGAVEEILAISSFADVNGTTVPLDDALREKVRSMIQAYSLKGFRVIAVAQKTNPSAVGAFSIADEKDMVLIGYLIFFDPPKESTAAVLKKLSDYGVEVKVLTGDTPEVTQYIAGLVGLKNTKTLLGKDVEAMDDTALQGVVESTGIFAKLSPEDKARVVVALRAKGHVVGYMNKQVLEAKKKAVVEINDGLKNSETVAVVSYQGLTVAELQELRRALMDADACFGVYKNTLVNRALKESNEPDLSDLLNGPNGFVFSKDVSKGPKALVKFSRYHAASGFTASSAVDPLRWDRA